MKESRIQRKGRAGNMKVLVAEQESAWLEFLASALLSRGLEPVRVMDGERAWSVLEERNAPRLAILNRALPRMNGIEICRQLRARSDAFYTFVLLLLPNSYRIDELVALEAGADDCLPKPFSQDDLGARLAIAQRVLNIDKRLTEINSRWRMLLDNLPFGVAAMDHGGVLKRVNTTFALQMGYTDPRQLLGQRLVQVLQRQIDVTALLDQVRWAEPFDAVEVKCRGAKCRSRSVRLWGRPLPQNDEADYEIVVQET